MDAGEEVGVVPGEPQPRPGVGLRAGGGAELGGDEVTEVLLGGVPADVLLHRPQHPPVHRRRGRHRSVVSCDWNGSSDGRRRRSACSVSLTAWLAAGRDRAYKRDGTLSESTPKDSAFTINISLEKRSNCILIFQQDYFQKKKSTGCCVAVTAFIVCMQLYLYSEGP